MKIDIPEKATAKQIEEIMDRATAGRANPPKHFDAKKYAGKMKWGQDVLTFQRKLRSDRRCG